MSKPPNYQEVAKAMEEIREMLRVQVAGIVAEGFSEEQARTIVTALIHDQSHRITACGCECNSGGWCGGCGHQGCGRR